MVCKSEFDFMWIYLVLGKCKGVFFFIYWLIIVVIF